ncbi:hypothetical protein [Streptomyces sp. L2]|uniref:hypothetical protein n=1 Tax=Streptomyces sp. L2 TaxID=2162665 RepID=UPI001013C1BF|nr:hypothetical protein [Streptomyces sp. L2]
MSRVYATVDDYQTFTGETPPDGTDRRLSTASRMLDRTILRFCRYDVDDTGLPTNTVVAAAFRDAVCAQVAWWGNVGDPSGADAVGWGTLAIGSVNLGRNATAVSGDDAPARQLAPEAADALQSPDLTPDIFRLGAVTSC